RIGVRVDTRRELELRPRDAQKAQRIAVGERPRLVRVYNVVRDGGDTGRHVRFRTQRSEGMKRRHGAQIMTRRLSMSRTLVLIAVLVACVCGSATAQSVNGSIQGTVVDQSGAVLPGVTVTVTNTSTGITRTTITDETGTFRAELLPVGTY